MRATADSNTGTIAYAEETVAWGTPPTANYRKFPLNGESLEHKKETVESGRVRDDRATQDLVEVGQSADGGIKFELSYAALLPFIAATLCSNPTVLNFAGNVTVDPVAQTVTGASGAFTAIPVGATVKVGGFANAPNNGYKTIIGKTGSTVLTFAPGSFHTAESAVAITLKGNHLKNGVLRKSYTWERRLRSNDGSYHFQQFLGMSVDSMSLSMASKAIITGELKWMGRVGAASGESIDAGVAAVKATGTLTATANFAADETVTIGTSVYTFKTAPAAPYEVVVGANLAASLVALAQTINGLIEGTPASAQVTATNTGTTLVAHAIVTGAGGNGIATTEASANASWGAADLAGGADGAGDYLPAPAESVVNATRNVGRFMFDNQIAQEAFKSLELTITNGLRGKDAMGTLGNFDVGVGDFKVEGKFSSYFADNALYIKFVNHLPIALSYMITDPDGNVIVVSIPKIQTKTDAAVIPGRNADVMNDLDWTAIYDSVTDSVIMVDYFPFNL